MQQTSCFQGLTRESSGKQAGFKQDSNHRTGKCGSMTSVGGTSGAACIRGLSEEVTFKLRPQGGEGVSQPCRHGVPGRRHSKCKGPESGRSSAGLKEQVSVAGAEGMEQKE